MQMFVYFKLFNSIKNKLKCCTSQVLSILLFCDSLQNKDSNTQPSRSQSYDGRSITLASFVTIRALILMVCIALTAIVAGLICNMQPLSVAANLLSFFTVTCIFEIFFTN